MLLVGSRATKLHFPSFREPQDWDVFATPDELAWVRTLGLTELPSPWAKKARFTYDGTILEVGIALPGTTNEALLRETRGTLVMPLLGEVGVASPEALLFLKRSHLPFLIAWDKSVQDVRFLRRRVTLDERWMAMMPQRLEETLANLGPAHRRVPRGRGRVCAPPEDAVPLHRALHALVRLGEERDARAFGSLARGAQLRLLAEEVMVIALERYYLRARSEEKPPGEPSALVCACQHMVTSSLSFELRELAVD